MTSPLLKHLLRTWALRELFLPSGRFRRVAPVVAWAVLLFILSSIPGNRYPEVRIIQFDKVVHFFLYVPLGLALARAMTVEGRASSVSGVRGLYCILLGALYGASDELHQLLVPNRAGDVVDWVIDVVAVSAGVLGWRMLLRRYASRLKRAPAPFGPDAQGPLDLGEAEVRRDGSGYDAPPS